MHDPSPAKQFLEGARRSPRCDWCARDKRLNGKGLCGSCNEVRKNLERMERAKLTSWTEKFHWRLAREKKKNCMGWGRQLPGILNGPVSGLDVERWFRMVARHIARDKKMYDGIATTLGWAFSAEQRQMLAYLFWEIFGEQASHHRGNYALRGSHKWELE
jgi:hypothetical protein